MKISTIAALFLFVFVAFAPVFGQERQRDIIGYGTLYGTIKDYIDITILIVTGSYHISTHSLIYINSRYDGNLVRYIDETYSHHRNESYNKAREYCIDRQPTVNPLIFGINNLKHEFVLSDGIAVITTTYDIYCATNN